MKFMVRHFLKSLPFALTKNRAYDLQTKRIVQRYCTADSCCIDVGTHKGEILDLFLKQSPRGFHYGFEPLPQLFNQLRVKYNSRPCHLYNLALSNQQGSATFNYVISNPAYSGLKKRRYDRKNEKDVMITVQTDLLDNLIPPDKKIDLIKIDVEGGELGVLRGSVQTLANSKPLVIFEAGIGGSDVYGTTPDDLFDFFEALHYQLYLMKDFLQQGAPLNKAAVARQFYGRYNYYFLAAPFSPRGQGQ